MNWYTSEACQEKANKTGKPVCAWAPYPYPNIDRMEWIINPRGRVKDFENPMGLMPGSSISTLDPWEDKRGKCYKRLFRPEAL